MIFKTNILLLTLFIVNGYINAQEPTIIKIGTQEWTTKNLDVVTFRNGDTIPEAQTYEEWVAAGEKGQPAWCNQANLPKYVQKGGKLYNWYAVNDSRGLAPKGFHVPSAEEWNTLVFYLGDEDLAGKKLKSTEGWLEGGNGTNESGFLALPVGLRYSNGYYVVGDYTSWWSSTEFNTLDALNYSLTYHNDLVNSYNDSKSFGFSVRLVRD
jgi:uncharacterized protein (TIGR02145 family)